MNQILLNEKSICLIRDTITEFGESISTKKIPTLVKINDKNFDTNIIGKITSHETTLARRVSQLQTNSSDVITLKNSNTSTNTNIATLNTKADANTNNINLQNNEIGAQTIQSQI